jgi:hypothetical protein
VQTRSSELQITANKMQRFLNLFIFTGAVRVSSGFSAHQQEHIPVHTASGIVNQYCC